MTFLHPPSNFHAKKYSELKCLVFCAPLPERLQTICRVETVMVVCGSQGVGVFFYCRCKFAVLFVGIGDYVGSRHVVMQTSVIIES